jgi:hypothetical protein
MSKSRTIQLIIAGKDRVSKVLKSITGGLKKWGSGALKITGGLVAGFGAVTVALGAMFSKLADQVDVQAKMASSLGIQNEALGAMIDAAGYAGISVENLSTALRKMSQGVADAANGTGEAKAAIEALGLDAAKLQAMRPEQAFTKIITELDKIPNGIQKTALAMDLFGRSGSAMTNLTSNGLKQAQKDAADLGLKLTSAQAANVEAANDAWSRIKNVTSDFMQFIAAQFAPSIKAGMDKAFAFLKNQDLKSWADGLISGFKSAAAAAINLLVPALNLTLSAVEKVTMAFTGWKLLWAELQYQFGGFMELIWTGLNKAREATNALHAGLVKRGLASERGNPDGQRIADEQKQILEMIAQKRRQALAIQAQELQKQKEQNQYFDDLEDKVKTLDQKLKEFGATAASETNNFVSGEKQKQAAISDTTAAINRQIAALKNRGGSFSVTSFSNALDDEADK